MENSRPLILTILLVGLLVLAFLIVQTENEKRQVKEDLVELSNVKYGLFNVDEWKKILSTVMARKIDEFELEGKNKKGAKEQVTKLLYTLINDLEVSYRRENSQSIGGVLRNIGAGMFGVFDEMRQRVPEFADRIVNFLNDPNNKRAVKGFLTNKLNEYADKTFSKVDYSAHDSIIAKYKLVDRKATILALDEKHAQLGDKALTYKYWLAILALLACTLVFVSKVLTKSEYILLAFLCMGLLLLGLMLPMIEIDARIAEMKLSLLGEEVIFNDQILYYKSKSILEVISLMVKRGTFDLLFVGLLVLTFSVLFPLSKLGAMVYLVNKPSRTPNKVLDFLVLKTGKWSMADVMVVAIFMSYIGFSGILTEQLNQLEGLTNKIEVLTTNNSSLQIGFFAFTSFALLSMLITGKWQNRQATTVGTDTGDRPATVLARPT